MNIRPVSDLRNKFPEIEELVLKEDEEVYLTKNGHGSMVVLSINKYEEMLKEISIEKSLKEKFGVDNLDKALDESEEEANNPNTKYYSHEEMKDITKKVLEDE